MKEFIEEISNPLSINSTLFWCMILAAGIAIETLVKNM